MSGIMKEYLSPHSGHKRLETQTVITVITNVPVASMARKYVVMTIAPNASKARQPESV